MEYICLDKMTSGVAVGMPPSIWTHVRPEVAAHAAKVHYGTHASVAVAWCAISARTDGRTADYRFWFDVFTSLCKRETAA